MSEESPSGSPFGAEPARGRARTLPLGREAAKGEPEGDSSRRLFFALWPDEATRQLIRHAAADALSQAGGRALPAQNLHMTLAFLGAQPITMLPALCAAAAQLEAPRGSLRLERLGHFARPRVLWIGPRDTPRALQDFVAALWSALAPLGIQRERRAFVAHLTLARKVERSPAVTLKPMLWRYAGFSLVASITDPCGAPYKILARWTAVK